MWIRKKRARKRKRRICEAGSASNVRDSVRMDEGGCKSESERPLADWECECV